jgi:glycosyltransferase involved in cell wall biosynthesis
MRVAMDARRLQDEPYTGVGRIMIGLLPYVAAGVDLVLLTDARRPPPALGSLASAIEVVPLRAPPRLPEVTWLQGPAANWLRHFDGLFHGTYNAVPFVGQRPSVVSMYDLTWEHHPEDFSVAHRYAFMAQARWSARHCRAVLTCSEFSRQDIIATYGVPSNRVWNVPPSLDGIFSPDRAAAAGPILDRLGVSGPYIVAMGGAKRRGLPVAIEAWRRLPSDVRPMFVVVGSEAPTPATGVVHAGRLNDADWSAVLAGATAFCYPTRYEGYGMPALEAAVSGVPVVCAPIGPLPEVLGDAAEWCASPTAPDIAVGLARVLTDEARASGLRRAGLAQAANSPTWAESAATQLRAYELALT